MSTRDRVSSFRLLRVSGNLLGLRKGNRYYQLTRLWIIFCGFGHRKKTEAAAKTKIQSTARAHCAAGKLEGNLPSSSAAKKVRANRPVRSVATNQQDQYEQSAWSIPVGHFFFSFMATPPASNKSIVTGVDSFQGISQRIRRTGRQTLQRNWIRLHRHWSKMRKMW